MNKKNFEIGYAGTINAKIKRGDTIISEKQYHNQGRFTLFKFICDALAGNFNASLRPCKIKLFNESHPASPEIYYSTTALARTPAAGEASDGYSITYSFSIPAVYITSDEITEARLYGKNSSENDDYLASFLFNEGACSKPEGADSLLLIEWTLNISNK